MMVPKRKACADAGFTLIELVLTVAIVGFIVTTLSGVMISYLKLSSSTQAKLNESTDQQLTSAYWQQDVSSLGLRSYDPTPTIPGNQVRIEESARKAGVVSGMPPGCAAGASGSIVVSFVWNDYPVGNDAATAWNAKVNGVIYFATQVGNQWELNRIRCTTGGSSRTAVVAHRLTAPPTADCRDSAGDPVDCALPDTLPVTVTLALSVTDRTNSSTTGYTTTLTGQRRQG